MVKRRKPAGATALGIPRRERYRAEDFSVLLGREMKRLRWPRRLAPLSTLH